MSAMRQAMRNVLCVTTGLAMSAALLANPVQIKQLTMIKVMCPRITGELPLRNGSVFISGNGFSGKVKTDENGVIVLDQAKENTLMGHDAAVSLYAAGQEILPGCTTIPFTIKKGSLTVFNFDLSGLQLDCGAAYQCTRR